MTFTTGNQDKFYEQTSLLNLKLNLAYSFIPFIKKWVAIEHKRDYYELFAEEAKKYNSEIVVVPESQYVTYPRMYNIKFDFILVDGLFREECIDEAFRLVAEDGVILLHDAGRIESAPILKKYEGNYKILCEGELMQSNGYYAHRGIAQFNVLQNP